MIQVLLSLQETEPEYYTDDIIKGLMLVRICDHLLDLHNILINRVIRQ
jgi:hypothetical protein